MSDLKCKTCIYYSEIHGCDKMIMTPTDDWIKDCPVYQQKDLYEQNEIKLVDVNALIEHLNATMYRDVIDEIKNFPTITPVLARQVHGTILLIPTRTFEDIKNGTMNEIRWTDKLYLDSKGNIRSSDGCPTDRPTVCGNDPKWCESCVSKGKCASTRPTKKGVLE